MQCLTLSVIPGRTPQMGETLNDRIGSPLPEKGYDPERLDTTQQPIEAGGE